MKWGKFRPWLALAGPLLAVLVLTAAPAGVKEGELSWPKWLVATVIAGAGVLVAVWTPLVQARTSALAARTTRATEREAQAEGALHKLPTRKGKVPLAAEVTGRALLGIHESIPLPSDTSMAQELSAELPMYVPRDIDSDMRTALEAMKKTGGFVLLVGPPASGKTRCAYEAVRSVLPDWWMYMPDDATTLTELVTSEADLKRSVVWLNEAQKFLTGSAPLKAATVRQLLADTSRPVILIGTIWSSTYDQLRTPTTTSLAEATNPEGDTGDLNKDSRQILDMARRFSLGGWTQSEWDRAEELASIDPRIEYASRHREEAGLTQTLSAAPELTHRWEQADDCYGQAVITAAVIARRCGHPYTIPEDILRALALGHLTGPQRAAAGAHWFSDALTWACRPVHHSGGIAPLQACAEMVGQVDGYQVSDILVDHTGATSPAPHRRFMPTIWGSVITLASPEACFSIGIAAYLSDMPTQARRAWERAAEAGHIDAMHNLGFHLAEEGEVDEARTWYTHAAEAGDTDAMHNLGVLLTEQGEGDEARTWYTHAAEAGHTSAMNNLGVLLTEQGEGDEARSWYTRAAEAGDTGAMSNLGMLLAKEGEVDEARTWFTRAADAGNTGAMYNLGVLLAEEGEGDEARAWYTRAAEAGHTGAMYNFGVLFAEEGEIDEARTWYTRAVEAGHTDAMNNLGALLAKQGEVDEARTWFTRAVEAGHTGAMNNLGMLLAEQGEVDEARTWLTRGVEAGHTGAMNNLGMLLAKQGEVDEARTWFTRAVEAGHTGAMNNLGVLFAEQGEGDEARTWYTRAAEAGHTSAMYNLGALLAEQSEVDEARTWYTRAAEAGHTDAMNNLGALLAEQGEVDEARTWYTRAAEAGDTDAMYNLGMLLAEQGEVDEAHAWFTRAAEAGDAGAMEALIAFLQRQGDARAAASWRALLDQTRLE
ncbi:tetratricopeptide repeat protein [Streptomyces colonosanans]|uniref:Sel1 repeat family protein n=1 Tax=Streptomyces colonosanans TaxID=1428652 RepID=A0A1S2P892_9ACTN|nr:tetratricopeptide repeat protein [Streptomyces colonosanans]OIJ89772.1 hypothetical protein BIV24_19340 [Streptomyces colonosanans]